MVLEHFKPGAEGPLPIALAALADMPRWVAWRKAPQPDGSFKKPPVPVRIGGKPNMARKGDGWNDPANLASLAEAREFARQRGLPGVGFVPLPGDGLAFGDLDDAIEPGERGKRSLKPWAKEIVDAGAAYCERSPSGDGVRIVMRGEARNFKGKAPDGSMVEMFGDGGYVTLTGDVFKDNPLTEAPAVLRAIRAYDTKSAAPAAPSVETADAAPWPPKSDSPEEILAKIEEASRCTRERYSPEAFEGALMAIPTESCSAYEAWLKVCGAVADYFVDDDAAGFDLFDRWSQRDELAYDGNRSEKLWDSLRRGEGKRRVTGAHVIRLAKANGWREPTASPSALADLAAKALTAAEGDDYVALAGAAKAMLGHKDAGEAAPGLRALLAALEPDDGITAPSEIMAALGAAKPFLDRFRAGLPPVVRAITPYVVRPFGEIPQVRFLYGRHLMRGYVSATIAPGGVGKSSLALVDAMSICTGRDLIGQKLAARGNVWYWGEDPRDEIERRIAAIMRHYEIDPREIEGRFHYDSARDFPLCVASASKSGFAINEGGVAEIHAFLSARGIDVVFIDPLAASHAVPENDNVAMNLVAGAWTRIADRGNLAVDLIHHTRKRGPGTSAARWWRTMRAAPAPCSRRPARPASFPA